MKKIKNFTLFLVIFVLVLALGGLLGSCWGFMAASGRPGISEAEYYSYIKTSPRLWEIQSNCIYGGLIVGGVMGIIFGGIYFHSHQRE